MAAAAESHVVFWVCNCVQLQKDMRAGKFRTFFGFIPFLFLDPDVGSYSALNDFQKHLVGTASKEGWDTYLQYMLRKYGREDAAAKW